MQNVQGLLLINLYAFLLIVSTCIIFFRKKHLKQVEDITYSKFLITYLFLSSTGLILGLLVSNIIYTNELLISISNKCYLMSLFFWVYYFTFYTVYVALKNKTKINKLAPIFKIIKYLSIIFIIVLPVNVAMNEITSEVSGYAIMYTYLICGVGIITQIACLISNFKNLKNKKFIPIYLLLFLGGAIFSIQVMNPSLNYLINPTLIFIAFIMYHTIENPDVQMIDMLLRNKELVENTVNDKSNFLFKVSQEMKKPIENIINSAKLYKNTKEEQYKNNLIDSIDQDANNAYFIINDITNVSSMDYKKIKMQNNTFMTKKLFVDLETSIKNQLSINNKNSDISFNFKTFNSYPEKLYGDYIKLKQIILSIVSNSIKYTEKGFIDIEVDTVTRYDVCRLVFTIKDSGKGMSISKINNLLSSNEDLENIDFDKTDNLDLKMPVVIKIIKMLGGSISIKSEEEKGTIVVVVIDQKINDTNDKMHNAKNYTSSIKSNKRILVASDDELLYKMTKILGSYNADVVSTLVGKDVVDKINAGDKYDLIILEDEMKPDSAYTILEELKKIKKFNIPVVIATNKDKKFIEKHFIEDGFSDCIIIDNIDNELKRVYEKYI